MWEAARESGALHGYAETEVFAPCVVKARETIAAGGIGRVLWVRSRESHSGPHSAPFWDIAKTCGGAMNDLGCHCIAAARYFFGKEDRIVRVMAWGKRMVHHDKTEGEDNALLVLEFASGKRIHSMSSNPDAQAGKRGGRILDEFALHRDQRKMWAIAYPGITWAARWRSSALIAGQILSSMD